MLYFLLKAHRLLWSVLAKGEEEKDYAFAVVCYKEEGKKRSVIKQLERMGLNAKHPQENCFACEDAKTRSNGAKGEGRCPKCRLCVGDSCFERGSDFYMWCFVHDYENWETSPRRNTRDSRMQAAAKVLAWKPKYEERTPHDSEKR